MATDDDANGAAPRSPTDMKIAIIGAGMGGLACALALAKKGFREIDVYEHAPDLGFVGAGIQLAPNLVRVLTRLGCWDEIAADATDVLETSIRDGATNEELTHVHMADIREKYGYPHCAGHRASLAGGMYRACLREPAVRFHLGHTLLSVDSFEPPRFTIQPRGRRVGGSSSGVGEKGGVIGEEEAGGNKPPPPPPPASSSSFQASADVLLAADGIRSAVRGPLLARTGRAAEAEDTGQAAYRVMVPRAAMEGDPEMLALLEGSQVTRWIGERRHWIAYPIDGRRLYNMSSVQPDTNFASAPPSAEYTAAGSTARGTKAAMQRVFADFCPLVRRLLALAPEEEGGGDGGGGGGVVEWKLRVHRALPAWAEGSVALLGDACHPTLPHLNQGAGMAVEDAAVLAEVLARVPEPGKPGSRARALRAYEALRRPRTSALVDLAALSGRALHLGEGPAREERDRRFAEARARGGKGEGVEIPDKWASPDVQEMIYSHDCMQDAADRFDEVYASIGEL